MYGCVHIVHFIYIGKGSIFIHVNVEYMNNLKLGFSNEGSSPILFLKKKVAATTTTATSTATTAANGDADNIKTKFNFETIFCWGARNVTDVHI